MYRGAGCLADNQNPRGGVLALPDAGQEADARCTGCNLSDRRRRKTEPSALVTVMRPLQPVKPADPVGPVPVVCWRHRPSHRPLRWHLGHWQELRQRFVVARQ